MRYLPERGRLRAESRVTASMMATPTAIRIAASGLRPEPPNEIGDASETGAAFGFFVGSARSLNGAGLDCGEGLMAGNRPAALPAPMRMLEESPLPMSMLASLFSAGMGPSGSTSPCVTLAEDVACADLPEVEADADAEVAATAVVSAAAGGVHWPAVAMLAVAVSVTDLTEVAFDATAICASMLAGCLLVTESTLHVAVPSPLAQPLVNSGFCPDGCAVSVTDTSDSDPFSVETSTA